MVSAIEAWLHQRLFGKSASCNHLSMWGRGVRVNENNSIYIFLFTMVILFSYSIFSVGPSFDSITAVTLLGRRHQPVTLCATLV